jgi:16S rRNA (guanine1516-N2)-methyltransferase
MPVAVDFLTGPVGYRLRHDRGRKHELARAAGFTKGQLPTVVDATAGFGVDAFMLASLGAQVTLIERSSEVYKLLRAGLAQAAEAGSDFAAIVARMTLLHGDSRDILPALRPDVVTVDPMHPARKDAALVKMKMRSLRAMVGADPDAAELMQVALATAGKRVVLKWPRRAAPLEGLPKPSHQILGKTVRYDVFMTALAAAPSRTALR